MRYEARVEITIPTKAYSNIKPTGSLVIDIPDDTPEEKALEMMKRVNDLALKASQSQYSTISKQMNAVRGEKEATTK